MIAGQTHTSIVSILGNRQQGSSRIAQPIRSCSNKVTQLLRNAALVLAIFASLHAPVAASVITIDFDSFPGMNFLGGTVPIASQLSNQLLATTGAVFSTDGGASFVGVANLEVGSPSAHAPSPPNGIGGATATGFLFYGIPILVTFFDPANSGMSAVTDFVSFRGDLRGTASGLVFLEAFDVNGTQLASDSEPDSGGPLLSVSASGIHSVKVYSQSGTVAFDNLMFNPVTAVTAVPEPPLYLMFISGLGLLGLLRRARNRPA